MKTHETHPQAQLAPEDACYDGPDGMIGAGGARIAGPRFVFDGERDHLISANRAQALWLAKRHDIIERVCGTPGCLNPRHLRIK